MRAVCGVFVQVCAAAGACSVSVAACQLVAGVGERTFDDGTGDGSLCGNGGSGNGCGVSLESGTGGAVEPGLPDVARAVEASLPDAAPAMETSVGRPDTAPEGAAGQVSVIDAAEGGPLPQTVTVGFDTSDVLLDSFYLFAPELSGAGSWGWDPDPDPHIVQLENVPSVPGTNAIYQGRELRDGRVSVDLWTTDLTPRAGVIARYVSETEYYRVVMMPGELSIIKRDGVDQVLACTSNAAPCDPIRPINYDFTSPGHTVMFEFIGPDLRFYVDGVLELQVTESSDSGVPPSGKVGIYCASMSDGNFDNFTIESLDGP